MLTPEEHRFEDMCVSLVFDLEKMEETDTLDADLAEGIREARAKYERAFAIDPSFNRRFQPAIIVFGKLIGMHRTEVAQKAGAFVIDLGLPGEESKTPQSVLQEMDEMMMEPLPPRPLITPDPNADPSIYYKPMHENEPELIKDYLRLINGSDGA